MRLHRFIGNFGLSEGQIAIEDKDFINQAKNVLRLNVGDKLILCDGNLNEAVAEIINLNKEFAELKILEVKKNENEPDKYVILYCPILKKENFELAVQKAVEVGIKEITPVITKRTVKLGLNIERLDKIIKEAAEQSGRGILPKLNQSLKFEEAIKEAAENNEINFFFDMSADQSIAKFRETKGRIGIFVGPEGGWDEEELKVAKEANFTSATLGKATLRAETAAIVASWVILNC